MRYWFLKEETMPNSSKVEKNLKHGPDHRGVTRYTDVYDDKTIVTEKIQNTFLPDDHLSTTIIKK